MAVFLTENESDKRLNLVHDRRMKPIMNINDLNTLEQLELFLTGNQSVAFLAASNKDECYRGMIFWSLKAAAYCCIPRLCYWRIRDTKGRTNIIRIRPCRSKRKKAKLFRLKTRRIIRHFQNNVFSLSMSTADAKFSELSKMFIGVSTRIIR